MPPPGHGPPPGYGPPPPGHFPPPPQPPYDPLVAYDFSSWLDRLLGVVKRSGKSMVTLTAVGALLPLLVALLIFGGAGVGLVVLLVDGSEGNGYGFPLAIVGVVAPLYLGYILVAGYFVTVTNLAVMKVATNEAAGGSMSLTQAYRSSLRLAWPTLGWVVLAVFVTMLGAMACYLPGLYLMVALSLVVPVMAFERQGGFTGSFRLVNSNFWPAAGRMFAVLVGVMLLSTVVQSLGYVVMIPVTVVLQSEDPALALGVGVVAGLVILVLGVAVSLFGHVVTQAGYLVTYAELRGRLQPGLNAGQLAAEANA